MGGDYGTTTGTVYASFYLQNSTSIFGSSDQQHQIIALNKECTMLRFVVYSDPTIDILFLTAQEGRIELAVDYVDYGQDNSNKTDFNDEYIPSEINT